MTTQQRKQFPFSEFEPRWQKRWLDEKTFSSPNPGDDGFDPSRPKYFVLDMFPYPSGQGLHVGHVEGYTATDIVSRFKKMNGCQVLHPMGWDAFGLPAEQYAIKTGQHPRVTTEENVNRFRAQLQAIGFSYDWDREVSTTDPGYFRWTQWIFLQLYGSWFNPETHKAEPIKTYKGEDPDSVRLAYVSEAPVNWCPGLGTVLANEEVVDGKSEVGGFPVERRPLRQWMLRITAFAERLIGELDGLDWPESIKLLQRNWIGRSEGAQVRFGTDAGEIEVFTTRPDTLFGATYLVLSPEHPLIPLLTPPSHQASVEEYQKSVSSKSDRDRTDLNKEKSGVFSGAFATNPANGKKVPIWVADYVLMGYGTGAIMAVPAHDERDFEFAKKFGIPVVKVVEVVEKPASASGETECFSGEGIAVNSGFLDGLPTQDAKKKMIAWLEENAVGHGTIQYKLRDWLFSRQRYWGEPFPILWEGGKHRSVQENELPVLPPEMKDFQPTGTPEPPLSKETEWVCYSATANRETNTMPQWAGSCWYYLRFCDPKNTAAFVGKDAEAYWMGGGKPGGVDLYVGGTEHAVLHLLYARFWHKVLFDLGFVSTPEPFQKLINQGMILGPDGQKMAKSRGNVVNPDEVIGEFGADSLRLYEMFMGPLEQMKPWSTKGVEGVYRFLARVWRLAFAENQEGQWEISSNLQETELSAQQLRVLHATIKKVTSDIETFSFNTAISQMMVCVNELTAAKPCPVEALRVLLRLLSPFAPHIVEEIASRLTTSFQGFGGMVCEQAWPLHDEAYLVENEVEIVVQINGKVRDRLMVAKDADRAAVETLVLASPSVQKLLEGKTPKKVVVVPGKLVNLVVAG